MLIFDIKGGQLCIVFTLLFLVAGCISQNEPEDENTVIQLDFDGEGGLETVELGSDGWDVVGVETKEGGHRIFGEVFDLNGELISENRQLELFGLGSLVSATNYVGFEIRHQTNGVLEIELKENASGKPYGIIVMLQNDNNSKRIYVDQVESEGYDFEGIEFYQGEDDGDSLYMRDNIHRYEFDFLEPRQLEVSPFVGPNVIVNSYFESEEMNAFIWFDSDSIEIETPSDIIDGNIYFSDRMSIYSKNPSSIPYIPNLMVTIEAPAGKSIFTNNIEMRKRILSYKLTIKSRGTSEIHEIEGKWIETSPTGIYRIDELEVD
ncbi:hypothetical protein MM236_00465 [Belliella sp. DSM 107340]|uniref:DUF4382 domain-containing protein n=1 Tax=Belliella calami TaxID=2923436 RepID=A0ABS9UIP4_9BACT|nr:hypothetical protein [Belliella calami]MCH7396432.1 hypothetical protein [Belliella calami]